MIQKYAFALGFALFFAENIAAQDSHYWNLQMGIRGMLLGGALTSSVNDNSAIYYNPACLALVPASHITVNATAYRAEFLSFANGAGDGIDLKSSRFSTYPQMMSSMLTHKPQARLQLGFAAFTRQSAHWDMTRIVRTRADILPQSGAADDDYAATLTYQNILNEPWLGLGAGYRLTDNICLGISTFLAYRNHRYLLDLATRASTDSGFAASYRYHDELRMNHLHNINKIGVHGQWYDWSVGLVITTPSLPIYGFSRERREISMQNLRGASSATLLDEQQGLPTRFKYPLSIAAGVSHKMQKAWFGLNAEYFFAVSPYLAVGGLSENIGIPAALGVTQANFLHYYMHANSVLNIGLGTEFLLARQWTMHLGARTDRTTQRFLPDNMPASANRIRSPNFDLYHLSTGFSWERRASIMGFGVNYSLGYSGNARQFVSLSNPRYDNFLLGTPSSGHTLSSHSFTFVLGYTYFFALK